MIPNTTQIPNNLFNGEMHKMKDTELRIVLIVARKTLGWLENIETGMRKEEDWISRSQLIKFTGKTGRAISTAIDSCVKKNWIEARSKDGELLNTPQKRLGKKIFYRLGKIFLNRVPTGEKSSQVEKRGEKSSGEKSSGEKSSHYKRNLITKETNIQNIVNYFFELKGWANKEKEFYKKKRIIYSRFVKPAKELLYLCDNDLEEAKHCLKKLADWAISRELNWSIETIFKKWYDIDQLKPKDKKPYYKGNRVFKMNNRLYILMLNGEKKEFAGSKNDLIYK